MRASLGIDKRRETKRALNELAGITKTTSHGVVVRENLEKVESFDCAAKEAMLKAEHKKAEALTILGRSTFIR